ncbi:hypothetical protein Ac2012v2_006259 [Leucoagaricus gongylophorus]
MSHPLASMTDLLSNATPSSSALKAPENHPYIQPGSSDSRSPCPALNTLANHGYIQRTGKDISFFELVNALRYVYNISWFLALFLTFVGFLISAKFTFSIRSRDRSKPVTWFTRIKRLILMPRWRIQLDSLSTRGPKEIAHDASFVHPNSIPSDAPDEWLLTKLLSFTSSCRHKSQKSGLSLVDMARYHATRERELSSPLNNFHERVALGECGLAWAVMRNRRASMSLRGSGDSTQSEQDDVIPEETLQEWLGREQLPKDWWVDGGSRPVLPIGFLEARRRAVHVANVIAK